jgi:hypothetical protein
MNYKGQNTFNIDELFKQVQRKEDAVIATEHNVTRIEIASEKALYFFTLPQHSAHPSVIIRRVVEEDGRVKIKTKGHTSADRQLFENWLTKFGQADWNIKKEFNQKH